MTEYVYQIFEAHYHEAGRPFGKSIRGLKHWTKTRLSLIERFTMLGTPIMSKAMKEIGEMKSPIWDIFK